MFYLTWSKTAKFLMGPAIIENQWYIFFGNAFREGLCTLAGTATFQLFMNQYQYPGAEHRVF